MLKTYNSSCKYRNMDIVDRKVLTYSWLKFFDKVLFTKHVCGLNMCAECSTGAPSYTEYISAPYRDLMSKFDVCIHIATHIVNNNMSMIYNQGYINIIPTTSIHIIYYIYSWYYTYFNIISVKFMY